MKENILQSMTAREVFQNSFQMGLEIHKESILFAEAGEVGEAIDIMEGLGLLDTFRPLRHILIADHIISNDSTQIGGFKFIWNAIRENGILTEFKKFFPPIPLITNQKIKKPFPEEDHVRCYDDYSLFYPALNLIVLDLEQISKSCPQGTSYEDFYDYVIAKKTGDYLYFWYYIKELDHSINDFYNLTVSRIHYWGRFFTFNFIQNNSYGNSFNSGTYKEILKKDRELLTFIHQPETLSFIDAIKILKNEDGHEENLYTE